MSIRRRTLLSIAPALVGLPGNVKVFTTDIYFSLKQVPPALGHASKITIP